MAKEATSFLKGVSRSQPSGSHDNHTRRRLSPFPVQSYSFYDWGHIGRKDWARWWPGSQTPVNICVIPFYDLLNIFVCFIRISLSWFCFSFSLWVGSFSPSPLTSGGPSQCLNFGPSSEPGFNRGLGSLFWGYASDLFYFSFPFSLCFRPVPPHSPQGYALPRAVSFPGGIPLRSITQGAPPFVGPLPPPDLVASRPGLVDRALLRLYDPSNFRSGLAIFMASPTFGRT